MNADIMLAMQKSTGTKK